MAKQTYLLVKDIRTDGGTQPRVELNQALIEDYAEEMREGRWYWNKHELPAVFPDNGNYWLAGGFHRLAAAKLAGLKKIPVELYEGTLRDAILFSVGTNSDHGLRRSRADKRNAVEKLLKDEEWEKWSDRVIAERCDVSHTFVAKIRESSTGNVASSEDKVTYERNGQIQQMATGNIAASNAARTLPDWWKEIDSTYFYAMCDERKEIDLEEESLFAENTLMFLKDRTDLIARSGEEILAAPDRFKDYESVLFRDPSADQEAAATSEPTGQDVPLPPAQGGNQIDPDKLYLVRHSQPQNEIIYLPGLDGLAEATEFLSRHPKLDCWKVRGEIIIKNWEARYNTYRFEDLPADAPAASPTPATEWLSTGDLIHSRKEEWALHLKDNLFYAVDHKNRIIHARGFAHSAAARDAFPGERMAQYTGANIIAKQHDHHKDFSLLLYREIQTAPRETSAPQPDVVTVTTSQGVGENPTPTPESDASPAAQPFNDADFYLVLHNKRQIITPGFQSFSAADAFGQERGLTFVIRSGKSIIVDFDRENYISSYATADRSSFAAIAGNDAVPTPESDTSPVATPEAPAMPIYQWSRIVNVNYFYGYDPERNEVLTGFERQQVADMQYTYPLRVIMGGRLLNDIQRNRYPGIKPCDFLLSKLPPAPVVLPPADPVEPDVTDWKKGDRAYCPECRAKVHRDPFHGGWIELLDGTTIQCQYCHYRCNRDAMELNNLEEKPLNGNGRKPAPIPQEPNGVAWTDPKGRQTLKAFWTPTAFRPAEVEHDKDFALLNDFGAPYIAHMVRHHQTPQPKNQDQRDAMEQFAQRLIDAVAQFDQRLQAVTATPQTA